MKLTLKMNGAPDHENLVILYNLAVAAQLRQNLTDAGLDPEQAWSIVETATFDLAMLLDSGVFEINGQTFSPRIAFVGADGELMSGAAEFDHVHDYATVFEDDLEPEESFSIEI